MKVFEKLSYKLLLGGNHCKGYDFATNGIVMVFYKNDGNPLKLKETDYPEKQINKVVSCREFEKPFILKKDEIQGCFDKLERGDAKRVCGECKGEGEDKTGNSCVICKGCGYTVEEGGLNTPHDHSKIKIEKHYFRYEVLKWVMEVALQEGVIDLCFYPNKNEHKISFFIVGSAWVAVMPYIENERFFPIVLI